MKKIPTLFVREYEGRNIVNLLPQVNDNLDSVLTDDSYIPTVKWDGSCCSLINGKFYKRYDAKRGKTPPPGAIPCSEPDPVTGHWPHWVEVSEDNPSDKWFVEAFINVFHDTPKKSQYTLADGTYEAIGPHFQSNPYGLTKDVLIRHGKDVIHSLDRSFEGIRDYLRHNRVEGIVFWKDGEPVCKIKRSDYGFVWPMQREEALNGE